MLDFFERVRAKRRRRADAAGKFSSVAILRWPSGRTRKILVPDIECGDLPLTARGHARLRRACPCSSTSVD